MHQGSEVFDYNTCPDAVQIMESVQKGLSLPENAVLWIRAEKDPALGRCAAAVECWSAVQDEYWSR